MVDTAGFPRQRYTVIWGPSKNFCTFSPYLPIHPSAHPSTHTSIHPSIHPLISSHATQPNTQVKKKKWSKGRNKPTVQQFYLSMLRSRPSADIGCMTQPRHQEGPRDWGLGAVISEVPEFHQCLWAWSSEVPSIGSSA